MIKLYIKISSIVGMIIWFFIGFIIWIPVLLVGTSNYCIEVMKTSLNGTFVNSNITTSLKNKINMYPRGFRNFELIIKSYSTYHDNN